MVEKDMSMDYEEMNHEFVRVNQDDYDQDENFDDHGEYYSEEINNYYSEDMNIDIYNNTIDNIDQDIDAYAKENGNTDDSHESDKQNKVHHEERKSNRQQLQSQDKTDDNIGVSKEMEKEDINQLKIYCRRAEDVRVQLEQENYLNKQKIDELSRQLLFQTETYNIEDGISADADLKETLEELRGEHQHQTKMQNEQLKVLQESYKKKSADLDKDIKKMKNVERENERVKRSQLRRIKELEDLIDFKDKDMEQLKEQISEQNNGLNLKDEELQNLDKECNKFKDVLEIYKTNEQNINTNSNKNTGVSDCEAIGDTGNFDQNERTQLEFLVNNLKRQVEDQKKELNRVNTILVKRDCDNISGIVGRGSGGMGMGMCMGQLEQSKADNIFANLDLDHSKEESNNGDGYDYQSKKQKSKNEQRKEQILRNSLGRMEDPNNNKMSRSSSEFYKRRKENDYNSTNIFNLNNLSPDKMHIPKLVEQGEIGVQCEIWENTLNEYLILLLKRSGVYQKDWERKRVDAQLGKLGDVQLERNKELEEMTPNLEKLEIDNRNLKNEVMVLEEKLQCLKSSIKPNEVELRNKVYKESSEKYESILKNVTNKYESQITRLDNEMKLEKEKEISLDKKNLDLENDLKLAKEQHSQQEKKKFELEKEAAELILENEKLSNKLLGMGLSGNNDVVLVNSGTDVIDDFYRKSHQNTDDFYRKSHQKKFRNDNHFNQQIGSNNNSNNIDSGPFNQSNNITQRLEEEQKELEESPNENTLEDFDYIQHERGMVITKSQSNITNYTNNINNDTGKINTQDFSNNQGSLNMNTIFVNMKNINIDEFGEVSSRNDFSADDSDSDMEFREHRVNCHGILHDTAKNAQHLKNQAQISDKLKKSPGCKRPHMARNDCVSNCNASVMTDLSSEDYNRLSLNLETLEGELKYLMNNTNQQFDVKNQQTQEFHQEQEIIKIYCQELEEKIKKLENLNSESKKDNRKKDKQNIELYKENRLFVEKINELDAEKTKLLDQLAKIKKSNKEAMTTKEQEIRKEVAELWEARCQVKEELKAKFLERLKSHELTLDCLTDEMEELCFILKQVISFFF